MIATCLYGAIALFLKLFIRNSKIAKTTVYFIVENYTEKYRVINRHTNVSFKIIEQ